MKTRTVTENTEITLDGKPWVLEKGDKIQIMEEPVDLSRSTNFTLKNLSGTPAALEWMKANGITPTTLQQTPQFKFPLGAVLDDQNHPNEGYGQTIVGYGVGHPEAEAATAARGRYTALRIDKPVYIAGVIGNADEVDGFDEIENCERDLELVGMDEAVAAKLMPPPAVETTDAAQSTCKVCGKKFMGRSERARCPDCLASQHDAAERATGVQ